MSRPVCDLCAALEDFCTCWRCMGCERLYLADVDGVERSDGELVCAACSVAGVDA